LLFDKRMVLLAIGKREVYMLKVFLRFRGISDDVKTIFDKEAPFKKIIAEMQGISMPTITSSVRMATKGNCSLVEEDYWLR